MKIREKTKVLAVAVGFIVWGAFLFIAGLAATHELGGKVAFGLGGYFIGTGILVIYVVLDKPRRDRRARQRTV